MTRLVRLWTAIYTLLTSLWITGATGITPMRAFVAPVATVTDFLSTVPLGPIQPLKSEGGYTGVEMQGVKRERERDE